MFWENVYKYAQTKFSEIPGERFMEEAVRKWSGENKEKGKTGRRE